MFSSSQRIPLRQWRVIHFSPARLLIANSSRILTDQEANRSQVKSQNRKSNKRICHLLRCYKHRARNSSRFRRNNLLQFQSLLGLRWLINSKVSFLTWKKLQMTFLKGRRKLIGRRQIPSKTEEAWYRVKLLSIWAWEGQEEALQRGTQTTSLPEKSLIPNPLQTNQIEHTGKSTSIGL